MEPPVYKLRSALDMAAHIRDEMDKIRAVLAGPGHFDADTLSVLMTDLLHYINFVIQRGWNGHEADTGISRDSTLAIVERDLERLERFVSGGTAYVAAKGGSFYAPGVNRLFASVAVDLEYLLAHDPLRDAAKRLGRFGYAQTPTC